MPETADNSLEERTACDVIDISHEIINRVISQIASSVNSIQQYYYDMNFTLEQSTTEKISPILDEIMQRIISEKEPNDSSQKDFLFVLLTVLMIENGMFPLDDDSEMISSIDRINYKQLTKWKTPLGLMDASFLLNKFEKLPLKLVMSPLGAAVLVNVIITDLDNETYSVCLPVSRYVVSPQASTIPMIFRDLKHLSMLFKNKIVTPVKSRILDHCGYPSASLKGMPEEVFFKIILYLNVTDIINVAQTSRKMQMLLENEILWHELYKRDFENVLPPEGSDWKTLYRDKYVMNKDERLRARHRGAGTMHDNMDYSDYVSYIDNPMWNVVI